MLKHAALSLAISAALTTAGHGEELVKNQTKTTNTITLQSVERSVASHGQLNVDDEAYFYLRDSKDKFGTTYLYKTASQDKTLSIRQSPNGLTGMLFADQATYILSFSDNQTRIINYNVDYAHSPVTDTETLPTSASQFDAIRPTSRISSASLSATSSDVPETAGAAFFISAQTFINAAAMEGQFSTSSYPEDILTADITMFNAALDTASVPLAVEPENFYLVTEDTGEFWADDDALFKAALGRGDIDFVTSYRTVNFEDGSPGYARLRNVLEDNFENAEQKLFPDSPTSDSGDGRIVTGSLLRESHVRYSPVPTRILAHSYGHNLGLSHNREVEQTTYNGALPYGYTTNGATTIMAYGDDQINYFSDPSKTVDGVTIGIEASQDNAADSAQFLRKTAPLFAHSENYKADTTITITGNNVTIGWEPMDNAVSQSVMKTNYGCSFYRSEASFYTNYATDQTDNLPSDQNSITVPSDESGCYVILNWVDMDNNLVPIVRGLQKYQPNSPLHANHINASMAPGETVNIPITLTDETIANDELYFNIARRLDDAANSPFTFYNLSNQAALGEYMDVSFSGSGSERTMTLSFDGSWQTALPFIESLTAIELQEQLIPAFVIYGSSDSYPLSLDLRGLFDVIPEVSADRTTQVVKEEAKTITVTLTDDSIDTDSITVTSMSDALANWDPDFSVSRSNGNTKVAVTAPADLFEGVEAKIAIVRVQFGDSSLFKDIGFVSPKRDYLVAEQSAVTVLENGSTDISFRIYDATDVELNDDTVSLTLVSDDGQTLSVSSLSGFSSRDGYITFTANDVSAPFVGETKTVNATYTVEGSSRPYGGTQFTVMANAAPKFDASAPEQTVNAGDEATLIAPTFSDANNPDDVTYTWSGSGFAFSATGREVTYQTQDNITADTTRRFTVTLDDGYETTQTTYTLNIDAPDSAGGGDGESSSGGGSMGIISLFTLGFVAWRRRLSQR